MAADFNENPCVGQQLQQKQQQQQQQQRRAAAAVASAKRKFTAFQLVAGKFTTAHHQPLSGKNGRVRFLTCVQVGNGTGPSLLMSEAQNQFCAGSKKKNLKTLITHGSLYGSLSPLDSPWLPRKPTFTIPNFSSFVHQTPSRAE